MKKLLSAETLSGGSRSDIKGGKKWQTSMKLPMNSPQFLELHTAVSLKSTGRCGMIYCCLVHPEMQGELGTNTKVSSCIFSLLLLCVYLPGTVLRKTAVIRAFCYLLGFDPAHINLKGDFLSWIPTEAKAALQRLIVTERRKKNKEQHSSIKIEIPVFGADPAILHSHASAHTTASTGLLRQKFLNHLSNLGA